MYLQEIVDTLALPIDSSIAPLLIAKTTKATLEAAPEALKHKFAVKISSMLKSKSAERAFGTYMAAVALKSPEIVRSHGASWCPILLHMLDLPNPECWKGAIKALCVLFSEAELRDIGGASKIVDFVKRLINVVPKLPAPALLAITHLCNIHPSPLRNYIPQILNAADSVVWTGAWRQALETRAIVTFADKTPAAAWREQVICILTDLNAVAEEKPLKWLPESPFASLLPSRLWYALQSYITIRPQGVKIPTKRLLDAVEVTLRSSNPDSAELAVEFLLATQKELGSIWALSFDDLFHQVVEISNYGIDSLLLSIQCTVMLLNLVKIAPNKYLRALHSLFNKGYQVAYPKSDTQTSTQSIASVADKQFNSNEERRVATVLAELSEAIILSVSGIPASFRSKIDANLLSIGGKGLRIGTLYPGKFSLLPITLRNGLEGYETLVHPRFPPLATAIESTGFSSQANQHSEFELVESEAMAPVPVMQAAPIVETVVEAAPAPLPEVVLEPIPQPTLKREVSPVQVPASEQTVERPDKRARIEETNTAMIEQGDDADEDEDDEFVIPTIEMDSD